MLCVLSSLRRANRGEGGEPSLSKKQVEACVRSTGRGASPIEGLTMDKGKRVQLDGFLEDGGKAYLRDLNEAQREAVTYSSVGGLQILAGPGSGAHERCEDECFTV